MWFLEVFICLTWTKDKNLAKNREGGKKEKEGGESESEWVNMGGGGGPLDWTTPSFHSVSVSFGQVKTLETCFLICDISGLL